ncbi:acyl-CoA thioesterase [Bacterioplanoides sp.]|uniref:acyl-CoA thioesterase n=1 Tax=Bacterioplanoides sp. TaxID=2066072 RepID=UPI003B59D7E1
MTDSLNNIDFYLNQVGQNDIELDSSWGQGRTTFGGMSAALILKQLNEQATEDGLLRSLNIAFCGPLFTEQACSLQSQVIRRGKSISHLQGQILQDNKVATLLNACYGRERESDVHVSHAPVNILKAEDGQKLPYLKGITPEFVRHIDFIYHDGQFPFTNSRVNHIHGMMRFSDHPEEIRDEHLVALIDAWPPTVLQKLKSPAPCASVTWSLEMVTPISQLAQPIRGDDYLIYEAEIRQAHDGYAHTEARIATQDGILLALSRQLIAVYDKR